MVVELPLRGLLVCLFVATAFSGCLGEETVEPGQDHVDGPLMPAETDEVDPVLLGLEPAAWAVGDHWTFTNTQDGAATMVVTEDLGAQWRIDTDNDDMAFFDALDDVSTLGPQRKSDLAGSQGSDAVQFFRFPLEVGDSWTTPWDGETRTIEVTGMQDSTWSFEARNESGGLHADYTYDATIGWFAHLDFYGADGSVVYGSTLTDAGSDWTGEVVRYTLETIASHGDDGLEPQSPAMQGASLDVDVGEGQDVYLDYVVMCDNGGFEVGLLLAEQPEPAYQETAPCAGSVAFAEVLDVAAGPGVLSFHVFADSGDMYLRLDLRTRTLVPVG